MIFCCLFCLIIYKFDDMKLISATLILLSFKAGAVFGAQVPKRDVTLTLSSSKAAFAADEPVLIDVTLANNEANKPARILDWVNPCNNDENDGSTPKEMAFFNIDTVSGQAAKYVGAVFKRGEPKDKDYTMLRAGEEISCTIDLSKFYEFAAASDDNNYEFKYSVAGVQLSGPVNNGNAVESLDSNILFLKVDARDAPLPPNPNRNLRRLYSGSNSFNGCTTSRRNDLASARTNAENAALTARNRINTVTCGGACAAHDEWFGAYDSGRKTELKSGWDRIYARLNDAAITFDCTCTQNYYAYVYPSQPYNIYLCNAFWSAPSTGTDSKMGTLIHEMSHFTVTADTDDHAYGQSACRTLADNNPGQAVNNADNHEYFAENTPNLSCGTTCGGGGSSCISGSARVGSSDVRDLVVGATVPGLNENMEETTCTVEAIGDYGIGAVYNNYTPDHFILNANEGVIEPNGATGDMEVVDKYAVLTSCPVGLDENGVGFTLGDGDFFGDEPLAWSEYVIAHRAILDIVRQTGPFVFSPSTYTSMDKVKQYTNKFHKTMIKCAEGKNCNAFEKATTDMVENALTDEAKTKIKAAFGNLGKFNKQGSIADTVSKGKSVGKPE